MGLFDWIAKRREAARQQDAAARQREEEAARQRVADRDSLIAESRKVAAQIAQAQQAAASEKAAQQREDEEERQRPDHTDSTVVESQEFDDLLAKLLQVAETSPAQENAAQRAHMLKKLQEHAAIVLKSHALLNAGLRSEADRLDGKLARIIIDYIKVLGPERAIELACITPFWESLISTDRRPLKSFFRLVNSPERGDLVTIYDNLIGDIIPIDVRSAIEKLSSSAFLDADGTDWESTGVLLGYKPAGRAIGHEGEGNILTVAPPGSGKGQCHVLPNILAYDGPMVVLDIKKAENFNASKAASKSLISSHVRGSKFLGYFPLYKFDPADPENSAVYNPLEFLPKSFDSLWSAAGRMAEWLCVPSAGKETYFDDRARQWLRGLIAATVVMAKDSPETPNIGQIVDFVFDDPRDQDKFLAGVALLNETPLANFAKNILGTSERERSATMNTIARSLEPWQDPIIRRLTSGKSTWSPTNLLRPEKVGAAYIVCESPWDDAIALNICHYPAEGGDCFPRFFICMPAGDVRTATSVVRVLIGQHTDSLMERECSRDDPPIIFMLDEFPQLGHMESIMRGVEMGRSAGLKFWFFAQDLQQIGRSYKPEDEAVILGSCVVQCFMNISTRETAQAVSQRLGTTRSVFAGTTRPLIPPEELLNSAKWKSKILCLRRQDEPLVLEKCMFKDML